MSSLFLKLWTTDNLSGTITPTTSTSLIYGMEALIGLGAGSHIQDGYAVIQAVIDPRDVAKGISFIMLGMPCPSSSSTDSTANLFLAQIGGITLGLAVASSVFINRSIEGLTALLPDVPHITIQGAVSGASSTFITSLSPEMRERVLDILTIAMRKV